MATTSSRSPTCCSLKMDQEREDLLGGTLPPYRPSGSGTSWSARDGDQLFEHYRDALDALGKKPGLIGTHLPQGTEQAF